MNKARLTSGDELPIGKILCIGRNYVDHIRELGNEAPTAPVIFMKPATSVIADNGEVIIPSYSNNCHHEAELALLVGKTCRNIAADKQSHFGLMMTVIGIVRNDHLVTVRDY